MPAVRAVIDALLTESKTLTTKTVADRAGVSRQAAQKQLKALVAKGELTVHGKARAAKYTKKGPDLWAKVNELSVALAGLVEAPAAAAPLHAQARMARTTRVEVASAGSYYRLSARLLLDEVDCDVLTLDFNGVEELGDEFIEEVFEKWANAHPFTKLEVLNLPEALLARIPTPGRPSGSTGYSDPL
ncbi:MAG: DUF4325 domain-containing protein [Myxococcaceae bacterium]|nr:DUF4325 domain-containing protein [Myxococcaceae bacterium]